MQRNLLSRGGVQALLAGALCAQAGWAQVGAPLLGYLPQAGHLVSVNGIAAAASAGSALSFTETFDQMAISPRHDFALVSAQDSGTVLIAYSSGALAGTTSAIAGASASPSSITLSPAGATGVLWFASSQTMQIVSGLPAAPVVRTVNAGFLAAASGDQPLAFTVSDDGSWAAGAWPSGVWAFGPNGEVRSIFTADRVFAMTFLTNQQNLAAATGSGVYSILDAGGSASVSTLFAGQFDPAGLAASGDGTTLVLADRRGSIFTINASTGANSRVDCACTAQGVIPMGGSIYRITNVTGSVFRVFDLRNSSVFQIPVAAGEQTQPPILVGPGRSAELPGGSR